MKSFKYIFGILTLCMVGSAQAQEPETSELYLLLKSKDSLLFDAAFNKCDVDTMEPLFTEDFEFYHDKGGFTEGREAFLKPTRENCEKRDPSAPQYSKRILIDGSLEVYPLKKDGEIYGAVQHGVHRFEFLNDKNEYQKGDVAKFTHVWMLIDGSWKIKRELSYNHHLMENEASAQEIPVSDNILDKYEGNYKSLQAGEVQIKKDNGKLLLITEKMQATLYPKTENTFFMKERAVEFKFIASGNGNIEKMQIIENNAVVDEAQRE
ncbi:MAG: nuclear transport factor 2 family protein [Flavobacteriaceae bacterium]|nr:nuclear transport factor 2 family protein [Flavobacteriaceae bacterium]